MEILIAQELKLVLPANGTGFNPNCTSSSRTCKYVSQYVILLVDGEEKTVNGYYRYECTGCGWTGCQSEEVKNKAGKYASVAKEGTSLGYSNVVHTPNVFSDKITGTSWDNTSFTANHKSLCTRM